MAEIPWFAWIAIVAIIMWGLIMIVGSITGKFAPSNRKNASEETINQLEHRITELEYRLNRMDQTPH